MINTERLIKLFSDLVSIDSPTLGERQASEYVKSKLQELGAEYYEDDAGTQIGGECGNIFAEIPGHNSSKEPILLCTHLDTVDPSKGKMAIVHSDGKITSTGSTVLGADDFSGVAAILEVLTELKENNEDHRPVELIFSVAEESYCTGIRYFDFSKCKSKIGFVLDLTGVVGTVAVSAPTILSFEITLHGKAAHAGFTPELGINTVTAGANAISKLQQGRLDSATTLNFGVITAGKAPNIVSDEFILRGEIRCAEHQRAIDIYKHVCDTFRNEAAAIGAEAKFSHDIPIHAYRVENDSTALAMFSSACNQCGFNIQKTDTFGGSDNAALKVNGFDSIVIANAMFNCHSTDEYTTVSDMSKTAEIVYHLLKN